jgi:hypothetical protein
MEGMDEMTFQKLKHKLMLRKKADFVYVAGKIRNDDNYKQHFIDAKEFLKTQFNVITAPEVVDYVEDINHGEAQEHQIWTAIIEVIENSQRVYFLDNWVNSPGAKLEFHIAKYYNKQIDFETNDTELIKEDFSGLIAFMTEKFGYPKHWVKIRLADLMLTKKCLIWILKNDYNFTYLSYYPKLGVQLNHSTLIHHNNDMEYIINTSKNNKKIYKDEITRLNLVRNLIHEYLEGKMYE